MTVQIIDKFLTKLKENKVVFPHSYLYLLGTTALFIAAKYEEVQCIPLDMIVKELGHNNFESKEVLQMEKKIL